MRFPVSLLAVGWPRRSTEFRSSGALRMALSGGIGPPLWPCEPPPPLPLPPPAFDWPPILVLVGIDDELLVWGAGAREAGDARELVVALGALDAAAAVLDELFSRILLPDLPLPPAAPLLPLPLPLPLFRPPSLPPPFAPPEAPGRAGTMAIIVGAMCVCVWEGERKVVCRDSSIRVHESSSVVVYQECAQLSVESTLLLRACRRGQFVEGSDAPAKRK